MHAQNRDWGTLLGVVGCLLASAGCAVEPDGREPGDDTADAPVIDPAVAAKYDFSCYGQPLPAAAPAEVTVHGFTNDSYTGGALPDVRVDLFAKADGHLLDSTASDDTGVLSYALTTDGTPVDHYARMQRDGHVTSYLYAARPLAGDADNVFFPVLPPSWREELAGYAGVDVDPTKGIVAVIVTDCAGARVEGATVAFDPPAEAIAYWDPTFTDASGDRTKMNGHAWGFNVPAGEVHATVSIGGAVYRDWPVQSFADGRTMSWRAP